VSVEHLLLLLRRQVVCDLPGAVQRVVDCREPVDEDVPPLEQLGELVAAQLPR